MPVGSKTSYTDKQKRQAQHIEDSAKKQGYSAKRAAAIGWATTNKLTGGGLKKNSASSSKKIQSSRSKAAKKGWATRRQDSH